MRPAFVREIGTRCPAESVRFTRKSGRFSSTTPSAPNIPVPAHPAAVPGLFYDWQQLNLDVRTTVSARGARMVDLAESMPA